jgi:anti-anti-sigma regulatory factor
MVQSDAVFKLRDAVIRERQVSAILLDFSELEFLGGGGVGMLLFLREWTRYRGIQLWLFDPPYSVRQSLRRIPSAAALKVASMDEVLELLDWEGPRRKHLQPSKTVSTEHLAA